MDGGKCRGVITQYYSQPSPSLPVTSMQNLHCWSFYSERSRSKNYKKLQSRQMSDTSSSTNINSSNLVTTVVMSVSSITSNSCNTVVTRNY